MTREGRLWIKALARAIARPEPEKPMVFMGRNRLFLSNKSPITGIRPFSPDVYYLVDMTGEIHYTGSINAIETHIDETVSKGVYRLSMGGTEVVIPAED